MFLKRCENCGIKIPRKANFCPGCGTPKKQNIIFFFLKMLVLFLFVQVITTAIPSILTGSILHYKYGINFVIEAIWGMTILIVMLLSGNSYVFTQKREKFWKSLKLGSAFLGMTLFILPGSVSSLRETSIWVCINLILYCAAIGITEEFLCRGWVQNEFLERFGKNRKQIILSIVLSSFIFGGMHISNIWNANQGFFETFLQIVQATASGVLLGSIYYRTKNIWTVAFLHGFYDFAIMLGDANVIKSCTTGEPTTSIAMYHLFTSFLIIVFYIISSMILLRKSKMNKLLDPKYEQNVEEYLEESKFTRNLKMALIVVVIIFFLPIGSNLEGYEDYYICYSYDELEIGAFEEHYFNQHVYMIDYDTTDMITDLPLHYEFEVFYNDKIGIKNMITEEVIYLNYENVYGYEVIDNTDSFIILVYDYDDDSIIHYMKMDKEILSNEWETLQEMKTSFESYSMPNLGRLGYLTIEESDYKYPLMISSMGDYFIIDEEDFLYLLR